jgi:aminoglycoside 3-N-acetyltransferase
MIELVKRLIPDSVKKQVNAYKKAQLKKKIDKLPKLSKDDFSYIISDKLNLKSGDISFVHSGIDRLNLDFSSFQVLDILLEIVGEDGTLIFPTYPKLTSYKFLKSGDVFDIRRTPSYMGILSELARRHSKAVRSLHPTKSVVAIGRYAEEITNSHHLSIYPYDKNSPYYKAYTLNAKAIGIGIQTRFFSALHLLDDLYLDKLPTNPYVDTIFEAKCRDINKAEVVVKTYAHDMNKMHFNLPKFFASQIDKSLCEDVIIDGMDFFRADLKPTIDKMTILLEKGISIYKY